MDCRINIRAKSKDKERWQRIADDIGISLSDVIRLQMNDLADQLENVNKQEVKSDV